jgi:chromosome segregation ATPase
LENHFLRERLRNMAPDHLQAEVAEGIKAKSEYLNQLNENKKMKKLLMQQDKTLAALTKDLEEAKSSKGGDSRELERMYREEKDRRKALEVMKGGDEDSRRRVEELEDEIEKLKGSLDDHVEEMERLRDVADRAQDELETRNGLSGSIGLGRGREARMTQRLAELEEVCSSFTYLMAGERRTRSSA